MENLTTHTELSEYAKHLIDNGYTIISPIKPSTYFHFFKDGGMGYVQTDTLGGGGSFTSEHKPCKEAGTGYSVLREIGIEKFNLENAAAACKRIVWREHAGKGIIKFWESPEEFVNTPMNKGRYKITVKA